MIHLKNLAAAPQRLQRMLLRVQQYDFKLRNKPGKDMALADTMSRQPCTDDDQIDLDDQITVVQFSSNKLQEIREATLRDKEMCASSDLPATLRPYWSYRDELSIEDGLISKGDRLIIPLSLQPKTLTRLHKSHQGIEITRLRARSCVYWKNMKHDIDNLIRKCDICQQMQRVQSHEPLLQYEIPTRVWQVIGTDLFEINRVT